MPKLNVTAINDELTGSVNYNTNTLFDYMVGNMIMGIDNKWYVNGGLSNAVMGCAGRNSTFKSTFLMSLVMNIIGIYKDSEVYLVDTEDSLIRDTTRILQMCKTNTADSELLHPLYGSTYDIDKVKKLITSLCNDKRNNRKEFTVTTPFMGLQQKARKAWIPTVMFIDSYSELSGVNEKELVECNNITDGKVKTIYMIEGNNKTIFLRSVRRLAESYGLVVVTTAHIGDKNDMGSYLPSPKEMQFMKQSDSIKNVGSKYCFLTSPFVMMSKIPKVLVDSNKNTLYPNKNQNNHRDLNEIMVQTIRTKDSGGGITVPFVISQTTGLLPNLSNYHYLKSNNNNYFGLIGNKQTHRLALYPDIVLSRQKIRPAIDDSKELCRALELTARYLFIRLNWDGNKLPINLHRTPQELYESIKKSKSLSIKRVLASRGFWCYKGSTHYDKEYLSIVDILLILDKEKV